MELRIIELDSPAIDLHSQALAKILIDSVADGASISFMAPLPEDQALQYWRQGIGQDVAAGKRILFGAVNRQQLVGTVQLVTDMPPNQPHRCEIAKMIVHPQARRLGIARALMNQALERARALGKTLVTLDTRTGDVALPLYTSVGFAVAGEIPDFAWDPHGTALHATTLMFRRL